MEVGCLPLQQMSQVQRLRAGADVELEKLLRVAGEGAREGYADDRALVSRMCDDTKR